MTPRRSVAVVLTSTAVLYGAFRAVGWFDIRALQTPWSEGLLKVAIWALPSVGILCLAWRQSVVRALAELGLATNPLVGYGFSLLVSLPMLVGPWAGRMPFVRASAVAGTVILAPLTEEILFRGLLFRQLYRHGGRNLARAAVISALAFAAAHFTRWDLRLPAMTLASQMGSTTLVGLVLAWMVYRWDSVWPAIGIHTCLNLSWELYGSGLVGGARPIPLRVLSIAFAVLLTLRFTRRVRPQGR